IDPPHARLRESNVASIGDDGRTIRGPAYDRPVELWTLLCCEGPHLTCRPVKDCDIGTRLGLLPHVDRQLTAIHRKIWPRLRNLRRIGEAPHHPARLGNRV